MILILSHILVSLVSFWLGISLIPKLIYLLTDAKIITSYKARGFLSNFDKVIYDDKHEIRKSSIFQKRLQEISKLIESQSLENKRKLEISYLHTCKVDVVIRHVLKERGFCTYETERNNSLMIEW